MARSDAFPGAGVSPFSMVRRFAEQMDRFFEDFGTGRGLLSPFGMGREMQRGLGFGQALWVPEVEVFQRDNELIIRADLPGLSKDDVQVEITDDAVTISGERKYEQEENRRGVYRSERAYGFFQRVIPLPEGVSAEDARATFRNGVLEIALKAPNQQTQGRRLEIKEGDEGTKSQPTTRH
jgi:HSP20 family protein